MSPTQFDVFVIGAGQAAWPLLDGLSKKALKLGLAERKHFGGSCLNFGCTPSKAVIESARVAHLARRGKEFGIDIPTVRPNFGAVMDQARTILAESVKGLSDGYSELADLQVFRAHARFVGRSDSGFELEVGAERVVARHVVLDTGTRSLVPQIDGLTDSGYFDTENWIDRTTLPASLAILGGGYIAVEMSQFYARMGSEVTIIERSPALLGHEDPDVSDAVRKVLEAEGIRVILNATVTAVKRQTDGVEVSYGSGSIVADDVMLAVGRVANTSELGLETIGLQPDSHGILSVNDYLQTSVEGVYAVGDIRGGGMFTSTAWDDGRIVLGALTGDPRRSTKDRVVPYAVFIDPELGRVGMTEKEVHAAGLKYKLLKGEMASNGRNNQARETVGFVKILVGDDDKILGAAVFGAEAAETSQIISILISAGGGVNVLRDAVFTHPTFAEAIELAVL